jgi:hypothetical protein
MSLAPGGRVARLVPYGAGLRCPRSVGHFTGALMANGYNGQPEAVPMACVVMEPALAPWAAQRLLFMLRCAWSARHAGL